MASSGDEGDKTKRALHEDGKGEEKKMPADPKGSSSKLLPGSPTVKRGRLQTISGVTATSVAALRRSGLRFTDVDDPNALRVQIPEPGDILFGRGRGFQEHPGNQRMLKIISKYKQAYKSQKRSRKREFVEAVYDEITKDGSRFLKKADGEKCWVEVSIPISLEKVSHTLRGKRKGEEALLSAPSGGEDAPDQLIEMQKRRRAAASTGAPTGDTGMTSDWSLTHGFGVPLLPNAGISMAPAGMATNSAVSPLQNPSQSILAQAQLGASSQLLPTNAASALSSIPQGLSAYGSGLSSAALSAYGNPFLIGTTSSLYGMPQTGSNPLLGATGSGVYGAPSTSLYGASSLARDPNLATDLARLELLRKQQLMNVSASGSPLLASQGPAAVAGLAPATNSPVLFTAKPFVSQPADAAVLPPFDNSSENKEKATGEKDSTIPL